MIIQKYLLLLNIYLLRYVSGNENLLFNVTQERYSSAYCIYNILIKHFPCGTLITFINPNLDVNELIQYVNGDNICHRIHVRSFNVNDSDWYIWTKTYVITAENLLDLKLGLRESTFDVFWNPRAKFIIQLNNLNDDEAIEDVFKLMMKLNVFKLIVLQNLENDAVIYTYYPFHNNNCGRRFDKVTLGTCEHNENITSYFPNDVPLELTNCSIKVVASEDVPNFISEFSNYTVYGKFVPGLEQYVLDTIAAREGFFIDYKVFKDEDISDGVVLENSTTTGILNFLSTDRADIAAGGYSLMKNRVELFDYLYGFNYASYNLFTPVITGHAWDRLYREFGVLTWCLITAAIILVLIVCQLLKIILNDTTYSILNVWGYFFGNANAGMSRNRSFRVIIFWWSWFTFFITSFYNTALVSLASIHVHETPHWISPDNLKTLPYKPCISNNTRSFFQFGFNQSFPEGELIHNCTFSDGALHYVASTKKYYTIEMEYSYTLKEYEYIDKDGHHTLEPWKFSDGFAIVMYLDKGFRFQERFQKYATNMYETGLIKNHLKTIHLRSYRLIKRRPKVFKNTAVLDLGLHFCILLTGYVVSFVCFLLEIWHHSGKQQNNYKKRT